MDNKIIIEEVTLEQFLSEETPQEKSFCDKIEKMFKFGELDEIKDACCDHNDVKD